MAIRSSYSKEDTCAASGAGAFLSLLNVEANDINQVHEVIDKVFESYRDILPDDQILIPPMVPDPVLTGVIMTRSLSYGAHYYIVNYDDESGRTDTITGGIRTSKTVYIYRNVREADFDSPRLKSIVSLAKRLEEICVTDSLDIEFSISADGTLYLLQVRPICSLRHWGKGAVAVNAYIGQVVQFVEKRTAREGKLYGSRSIIGIMPDWNPAEMIGIVPHHLDTSLYREIITSHVWASARRRMGYHHVYTPELMVVLADRPYIDVRLSFNSFLPKNLDPVTSEALVSAWLEYLAVNPQYHDKVEFEVAQTYLDFCFEENLNKRYGQLLTKERRETFRNTLCHLTSIAMSDGPGSTLNNALDRIMELRVRNEGRSVLGNRFSILHIGELLSECRKYGTLPFAIILRHAFIAESLLKTAIIRGAIQPERVAMFKRTIRTI